MSENRSAEIVYIHQPTFMPYVDPLSVKHPRTEFKGWLTIHARRRRRADGFRVFETKGD